MRKSTLFIVLMLASLGNLKAQHISNILDSTMAGIDTSFFYEESFIELDTSSYLTTSRLWDRAPYNLALDEFTGTSEASGRVTSSALAQGYLDIRASDQSNSLPDYDSLINLTEILSMGYDAIPITILDYTLNRIQTDAFTQGLLSLNNGILSTTGVGDPFEEMEVFMAGMLNQTFPLNDTFSIVAPYITYNGSNLASINTIRINFNDGNGWINLTWNESTDIYLTGEEGEFDFEIELTYSDQSIKTSKNKGAKKSSGCIVIQPEEAPWGGKVKTYTFPVIYSNTSTAITSTTITRNIKYYLSSTDLYKGKPGDGKVYVRYRNNPGSPRTFKKPVIIVEGIDFGKAGMPLGDPFTLSGANQEVSKFSNTTRLGTFGWPEMFGCNSNSYPNAKMPHFVDSLYNNNNDLILLDFLDGADYIQRNAMLLKELINRINQNKVGDEEIVIVAVSMGGQVARYALTEMESQNEDHCVRLFASHDSPWKGANISASIQFFAKYTGELQNAKESLDILNMLNRPAAKQLLLFHYKNEGISQSQNTQNKIRYYYRGYNGDGSDPLRQQFINELNAIGDYPKKCRNVAVANGNSGGVRKHSEGATQYSLNSNCAGYDLRFNFYDLNRWDNMVSDINSKGNYRRKWHLYGLPALNGVAGGYRDDFWDIKAGLLSEIHGNKLCGGVTVPAPIQDKYCFVPTISALNISNADWDANASIYATKEDPTALGNTHFEAYYAPSSAPDQDHGEVTDANITWLMKEIRFGEKRLEVNTSGILTKSWNTPTQSGFIGSIDINTGGTLYLNANANLYDYTAAGSPTTVAGSTSHVRIGSACGSTKIINVNSGGKMVLGDIGPSIPTNNKAYLYITDGAEVRINNGGEVTINTGSKFIVQKGGKLIINSTGTINPLDGAEIVIEDGGELVYNSGADIDLSTYGSVLKIQGKLTVGNNANFTFSGYGKIIFDQNVKWATNTQGNAYLKLDDFWDIGSNATFTVHGSTPVNYDRHLILAEKPVYMKMEDGTTFNSVDIRYGRIALNEDAMLGSFSPTQLIQVKVDGYYSYTDHNGFWLWNAGGTNFISQCKFEGGNKGLRLDWIGGGTPATISACEFNNNGVGIEILRGPFKTIACDFDKNNTAIYSKYATGLSLMNGCDISKGQKSGNGLSISTPQQGATFTVTNSKFTGLLNAINFQNSTLRSTCTEYGGCSNGISYDEGILDISDGAKNTFHSNDNDIELYCFSENTGILLDNGENDFEARGRNDGFYITGYIDLGVTLNSNPIQANMNNLPTYIALNGPTIMPTDLRDIYGNLVPLHVPNPATSTNCNGGSSSGSGYVTAYSIISGYTAEGGVINTSEYSGTLKAAALDALQYVSSGQNILNDELALTKINSILQTTISNTDGYTSKIQSFLYANMHVALNQAYQYGSMHNTENGEPSVNDTVEDVIDIIDDYLSVYNINDSTTYDSKFRFTLDKVHAYRVSGYYDLAMNLLNNTSSWTFNNDHSMRAGYWQCVCEAERAFFEDEMSAEDFDQVIENCKQQYVGYTSKSSSANPRIKNVVESNHKMVLSSYPQPTSGRLTVVLSEPVLCLLSYQVSDVSGKILLKNSMLPDNQEMKLDVSRLPVGVYFLSISFNSGTEVVKFSKE